MPGRMGATLSQLWSVGKVKMGEESYQEGMLGWRAGPGISLPRANGSLDGGGGMEETGSRSAVSEWDHNGDGDQLSPLPPGLCPGLHAHWEWTLPWPL